MVLKRALALGAILAGPALADETVQTEPRDGAARPEFEYEIPVDEAETMLKGLCRRPLIEKTRHEVVHAGHLWQVDEFGADNAGLVTAEVELERPDEPVELPPWVGEEVTLDPRYSNSALAASPMKVAAAPKACGQHVDGKVPASPG